MWRFLAPTRGRVDTFILDRLAREDGALVFGLTEVAEGLMFAGDCAACQ